MGRNVTKWGRTGTKWVEMLPNRYNVSKWVEMLPNGTVWVDMLQNE